MEGDEIDRALVEGDRAVRRPAWQRDDVARKADALALLPVEAQAAVEDDDRLVGLVGVPGVFLARNVALDLDASLVWQRRR